MTTDTVKDAIRAHAVANMPREACGLLVMLDGEETFIPCKNTAGRMDQFRIDPDDYADAEDKGEITAIVHSHPNGRAIPSEADKVAIEDSGKRWIILGWPIDEFAEYEPQGYIPPLTGRPFTLGVLDCYTLVRDYYKVTLGIEIPKRPADWESRLDTVYFDEFTKFGFAKVDELQLHDLIIMNIKQQGKVHQHAAIYLGDNIMLHHPHSKLSSYAVYGGVYMKWTVAFLRHTSLEKQA